MRRTATRLADGRELLYFDDDDAPPRTPPRDPRDLAAVPTRSVLRHDPLLDEWVAMAAHRQDRTHLPPSEECPLCPSRAGRPTEVPAPDYDVVVFENRFPSLVAADRPAEVVAAGSPLFRQADGGGRCEVVCFTPDHDGSLAYVGERRFRTVLAAWTDRTVELGRLDGVAQVFCFENRGEEIGVTLRHPHGQVYAYPFVTPRTRAMLAAAARHRERTGRSLVGDLLAAERSAGERVVVAGEHWTAYVPFAARWPVEVHVVAHRQVPDLAALDGAERAELGPVYLDVLRRLDALYGSPLPYVSAWHQAPAREGRDLAHLHAQVFSVRRAPGKLKYLAGSESAMGAFVSDVTPEQVAARLRAAGP